VSEGFGSLFEAHLANRNCDVVSEGFGSLFEAGGKF